MWCIMSRRLRRMQIVKQKRALGLISIANSYAVRYNQKRLTALQKCRNNGKFVSEYSSVCSSNPPKRQLYNHSTIIVLVCARQRKAVCAPQPLHHVPSPLPLLYQRIEGVESSSARHSAPHHSLNAHRLLQHRKQLVRQHPAARGVAQLQHQLQPLLVESVQRSHLCSYQRFHQRLVVLPVPLPQRLAPFASPPRLQTLHQHGRARRLAAALAEHDGKTRR